MFKKFLSRKLLVIIATGIADFLIITGQVDPVFKTMLLKLITGLGALYVSVEGIRDIVIAIKKQFD